MAKIYSDPDTWIPYCMQSDLENVIDPATVELKLVNNKEMERYQRIIATDGKGKDATDGVKVVQGVSSKQFCEHVRNPKNFFRLPKGHDPLKPGPPIAIKTAQDLYDYGDISDIIEIIKTMESNAKLTELQKKTSDSGSGTLDQEQDLTAQNAQT